MSITKTFYVMTAQHCNPEPAFNALIQGTDRWEVYLYESYEACNRAIKDMGYDNLVPHPVQYGEVEE